MTIYIDPPKKCDICKGEIGMELYDIGPWACFNKYGVGLGTGYVRDDIGRYMKVEG